jgi:hypothetical protein
VKTRSSGYHKNVITAQHWPKTFLKKAWSRQKEERKEFVPKKKGPYPLRRKMTILDPKP